jgi:hypothetical protein
MAGRYPTGVCSLETTSDHCEAALALDMEAAA